MFFCGGYIVVIDDDNDFWVVFDYGFLSDGVLVFFKVVYDVGVVGCFD